MTARAERLRDARAAHPWLTAAVLAVLSGTVLLARLSTPSRIVFDETYYVEDALGYLETGVEPSFAVHPPLGKWLIALGIELVGDRALGWRITAALAGVVTVLLTHQLARLTLGDRRWGPLLAVAAPLLLLADGLFITQSRIAMLDSFLVTATVAGMVALVADRRRRNAAGVRSWRPSLRWVAGIAFGLALAVKWSGLLALGAAGLLTIAWELGDARRSAATGGPRLGPGVARRAAAVVGSLLVLPAVVYALSWLPWLAGYEHTWAADCDDVEPVSACEDADASVAERVGGLGRYHDAVLDFHLTLESQHSYRSDPLGWVVLQRPVVYYWESCSQDRANGVPTEDEDGELVPPEPCEVPVDTAGEILAVGNPALWWGFLAGLPLVVAGAVRRDGRSAVVLVTWLSLWAPWLVVSRASFLFYMAPAVPFIALGLVVAIDQLDERRPRLRTWLGLVGGAAVGTGAAIAAQLLVDAPGGWRQRFLGLAVGAFLGTALGALQDLATEVDRADGRADDEPPTDEEGSPPTAGTSEPGPDPATTAAPSSGGEHAGVTVLTPTAPTTTTTAPAPPSRTGVVVPAPAGRVPALLLTALVVTWALWSFFGPVWYAVPLDRDVLEWRWWLRTWV